MASHPQNPTAEHRRPRSYATPLLVLGFGLAQVGIIYVMLVVDSPISSFTRRAAETWPGRITLAAIGLGVIVTGMIAALTVFERLRAWSRRPT